MRPVGQIAPNPAIQSNLCHSFLATDLEHRGAPELDGTEDLEVVLVPLDEICHALVVVVAFCFALGLQPSLVAP